MLVAVFFVLAFLFKWPPFSTVNSDETQNPALAEQAPSETAALESVEIKNVERVLQSAETSVPEPVTPERQVLVQLPNEPEAVVIDVNDDGGMKIKDALSLLNERPAKVVEARERLNELLTSGILSGDQKLYVKNELSKLADRWLFSSTVFPGDDLCGTYKVQSGDRLIDIGSEFSIPYEILMQINRISSPSALRAGEAIKVVKGPFHARVHLATFTLDLYMQDVFVRSFKVGLAKPPRKTPTGMWRVKSDGKLISPPWTDPDTHKTYQPYDPDYPLGSRWIGLEGLSGAAKGRTGFAIHGTKDKDSIGTASSRGCIRLYNGDVILMYKVLKNGVSQVEVVD
jgi:LysM repeat protein